jgi:hypothetical protein
MTPVYTMGAVSSRNHIGPLLTSMGLTGIGVEIGTHRADYACILLDSWEGHLVCVDPWCDLPGYDAQARMLWDTPPEGRGGDRKVAQDRLKKYNGRATICQSTSEEACDCFSNERFDFIHLDGDHTFDHVLADLRRWWPKLKPGGIMLGHDWLCPGEKDGSWGRFIQPAVHQFASEMGIPFVYLLIEENGLPWSFYLIKS